MYRGGTDGTAVFPRGDSDREAEFPEMSVRPRLSPVRLAISTPTRFAGRCVVASDPRSSAVGSRTLSLEVDYRSGSFGRSRPLRRRYTVPVESSYVLPVGKTPHNNDPLGPAFVCGDSPRRVRARPAADALTSRLRAVVPGLDVDSPPPRVRSCLSRQGGFPPPPGFQVGSLSTTV